MATTAYTRPILGWDNRTGQFVALVPSATTPGKFWITTATGCECPSFRYRGNCRHLPKPRRDPAKVAANASLYAEIWQDEPRPAPARVPLVARLQA